MRKKDFLSLFALSLPDYYAILGANETADAETLKKAYRKLAMQYHPDLNPSADAHRQFALINQAYHTLSDPAKRRRYDLTRNQPQAVPLRTRPGGADNENARRFYQFMAHQQAYRQAPPKDPEAEKRIFTRDLITTFLVVFFVAIVGFGCIGALHTALFYLVYTQKTRTMNGWAAVVQLASPVIFFFVYRLAKRLLLWRQTQGVIERLTVLFLR